MADERKRPVTKILIPLVLVFAMALLVIAISRSEDEVEFPEEIRGKTIEDVEALHDGIEGFTRDNCRNCHSLKYDAWLESQDIESAEEQSSGDENNDQASGDETGDEESDGDISKEEKSEEIATPDDSAESSGSKGIQKNQDTSTPEGDAPLRWLEDVPGPHAMVSDDFAATCGMCHPDIHDDWIESPHAMAMTSDPFTLTIQNLVQNPEIGADPRLCWACHAPHDDAMVGLRDDGTIDLDTISGDAINCIVCHSQRYLTGSFYIENRQPDVYSPRDPEWCAGCHFPGEALLELIAPEIAEEYELHGPMGNPVAEWRETEYSVEGDDYTRCIDCHGERGETGTLHQWPDDIAEMVRYGIDPVEFIPVSGSGGRITTGIRITNRNAGHMFPTGDPGRMLTIEMGLYDSETSRWIDSQTFYLGKFLNEDGELDDNRLMPGESIEFLMEIDGFSGNSYDLTLEYSIVYGFDPLMEIYLNDTLGIEPDRLEIY